MFDVASINALEVPLPPSPPAIVREGKSPRAESAQRVANRWASAYEQQAAAWLGSVRALRQQISVYAPTDPFTPSERTQIGELISDLESVAEDKAKEFAHFEKKMVREIKRQFAVDSATAAATRLLVSRIAKSERDVIEGLLDYALFLRAFRADRIPDSHDGPSFTDPDELRRYLESELT